MIHLFIIYHDIAGKEEIKVLTYVLEELKEETRTSHFKVCCYICRHLVCDPDLCSKFWSRILYNRCGKILQTLQGGGVNSQEAVGDG